ncbi:MAG: hypothetical protein BWY68_00850 [bacterium ADurb.Bin400]|nr:MAG: hypothetical protein BWY68_00850 [bacterium ADurb.Bin400]
MAVNWLACEIDEILKPHPDPNVLVNYVYSTIEKNIKTGDARISAADNETQCKLAIFILVFKPDTPLLQFWAIRRAYPEWSSWSVDEVKRFARSFDPYYNKVDKILLNPLRKRYLQFAKRYIAPFILLNKLVNSNKINLHTVQEKPALLKNLLVELYDQEVVEARQKVWRGTTRALLFVFLTKISLAFILEVPVDRFLTGEINYLSLGINVYLPPLLMLVAGTFVKAPPAQNRMVVADAVSNILYHDKINNSTFVIKKKKTGSGLEDFFDVFYLLFSGLVLVGVVRLLLYLHFNFLSIILFFFFVSVVSFFSFRIRTMALELAMRRAGDGGLTSWVEFFFLPFIQTGKLISEKFAQSNPFILALDFLIEAPFKSIMKILGLWFKFINAKKEEIEL